MGKLEDRLRRGPLFITLIYLCLGFAWILLSDRFAEQFAVGERALSFLQSVKGFLYVVGTGLILYLLLRSWRSQLENATLENRRANRSLRMLTDCNQALMRAEESGELVQDLCRIISEIGRYEAVWAAEVKKEKR